MKIPMCFCFFAEMKKADPEPYMELQVLQIKILLKRRTEIEYLLLNFKTYCKVKVIKTVWSRY